MAEHSPSGSLWSATARIRAQPNWNCQKKGIGTISVATKVHRTCNFQSQHLYSLSPVLLLPSCVDIALILDPHVANQLKPFKSWSYCLFWPSLACLDSVWCVICSINTAPSRQAWGEHHRPQKTGPLFDVVLIHT